ncbi:L-rhamnose 1-epimeras-like protein [Bimuria novae-zelandiae CBS 107.79]|uniref:L-rhamnose 1-epimeras-like protein n=1 Tax=Bimuria novae-zelandiae CBS 107.79 TaxID=1447943 RepID=A0A6A5V5T7_9PLEO|nr:L-rhamnose 1-epimeras-like protein [Bimuria novae-zelandiae CBS 107.79]
MSTGLWQPAKKESTGGGKANQGPRRIGQWLYLRPECIKEYKKCHAAVWPEVLEQIRDSNVRDYSIYLTEGSKPMLFASFKYVGDAFDADMARMAANPKVQEWWRMTDGMQESPVAGATGSYGGPGWWGQTEEVFFVE